MEKGAERYFQEQRLEVGDPLLIESVRLYGVIKGVSTERKDDRHKTERTYFLDVSVSLVQEREDNSESIGKCSEPVKIRLPVDKLIYDKIDSVYDSNYSGRGRAIIMGNLELHCATLHL